MKMFKFLLIFMFGLLVISTAGAVSSKSKPLQIKLSEVMSEITVGQFLAMDIDRLSKNQSVKVNWLQRSVIRIAQKKFSKRVSNGKLRASTALFSKSASGQSNNPNIDGLWALLFGSTGFLFAFLGPLAILTLPMAIAAIVLGIIGIKKDQNSTMAIIGLVLGGVTIFLLFLAVVIILSVFA
ncbi:MAG: hypothetical protein ABI844_05080 [Saprospiraceae bacterium]